MTEKLDILLRLLENNEKSTDYAAFLNDICYVYGLKNAAYMGMNFPGVPGAEPVAINTYSSDWAIRYREASYVNIDPVISQGIKGILPLNWSEIPRIAPKNALFFAESIDFGVGRQGTTIPVRGARGERALFSISSDDTSDNWGKFLKDYLPDMHLMAHHLHSSIASNIAPETEAVTLSPREKEVLQWCANGKSNPDVAAILGISEHTVRHYVENARYRLNALNIAHAVARAIQSGLIPPPK